MARAPRWPSAASRAPSTRTPRSSGAARPDLVTRGPDATSTKRSTSAPCSAPPSSRKRPRWGSRRRARRPGRSTARSRTSTSRASRSRTRATLFWGFMDVDFRVAKGGAPPQTVSMRLHNYNGGYNAGMGRKDEASVALAHLLGAKVRRRRWRGSTGCTSRRRRIRRSLRLLDQVKTMGEHRPAAALHRLGLSGSPDAPAVLLALVPAEPDENRRSSLIEALGRLGAAAARARPQPALRRRGRGLPLGDPEGDGLHRRRRAPRRWSRAPGSPTRTEDRGGWPRRSRARRTSGATSPAGRSTGPPAGGTAGVPRRSTSRRCPRHADSPTRTPTA